MKHLAIFGLGLLLVGGITGWVVFWILISGGAGWGAIGMVSPLLVVVIWMVGFEFFAGNPYKQLTKEQRDWMEEWSSDN